MIEKLWFKRESLTEEEVNLRVIQQEGAEWAVVPSLFADNLEILPLE